MSASKPQESGEVRIAHSLNRNEEVFAKRRRNTILQSLDKLQINCSQDRVPNIALLGSGGGQRAMVGLLGSLVQLQKAGLLDCVLYLSGVSGSTWCMASLYQEPDWSTKLESVKNKIVRRISGPVVTWTDAFTKLKKYYYEKDYFSLTDIWAVMVITTFVKETDECKLKDQWSELSKDPFPIYSMIDKHCKQQEERDDPWFEITPHEAGYSLTGAFVDTSDFGSRFDNGLKKKQQEEMDMLYLQALCGSALADGDEIKKFLWEKIKEFFKHLHTIETKTVNEMSQDPDTLPHKCHQVLMDLVDMNLAVLNGQNLSDFHQSIRTPLKEMSGGKHQLIFPEEKQASKLYMKRYTEDVCNDRSHGFTMWPSDVCFSICKCMAQWTWGRNYDFLHDMTDKTVPDALLQSETRDYEDAGLLLNSPYFPVLRKERNTDLIISLDFSGGDPFKTVREAAKMCRKLNLPFPPVNIPDGDVQKPRDFYVFKGQNAPTVIHMPLFNVVNCGGELEDKNKEYETFQGPYSAEMITDLMNVAGRNISNNREKLLEEIRAATEKKAQRVTI